MKRLVLDFENDSDCDRLITSSILVDGNAVFNSLRSGNQIDGVHATIVKEEYLIANLTDKLKSIRDGVSALKKSGFTMELLEAYMQKKGVRVSDFRTVIQGISEFFYQIQ